MLKHRDTLHKCNGLIEPFSFLADSSCKELNSSRNSRLDLEELPGAHLRRGQNNLLFKRTWETRVLAQV